MKYRVIMSCYDGDKTHYYSTEIEGVDVYDAGYKARLKYATSEEYPKNFENYSLENKIEEPTILSIDEI
jgi:hypothetical protein